MDAVAMRPDRENLISVADAVHSITVPVVGEAAEALADEIGEMLLECEESILAAIHENLPE